MIIRKLKNEEFEIYYTIILELMIATYVVNFQLSAGQSKQLCLEKMDLLTGYINQGNAIVFAAIEENKLIGFMWLYKHDFFGEKRLHVNQIAVNSSFRGKGIGLLLMQEAEKQTLREGIDTIDLFVSEINSEALSLYEKMDFKTERRYMKKKL